MTSLATYSTTPSTSSFHMSGHHPHPRPSLQSNSPSSNSIKKSYDSPGRTASIVSNSSQGTTTHDAKTSSNTQPLPSSRNVPTAERSPVQQGTTANAPSQNRSSTVQTPPLTSDTSQSTKRMSPPTRASPRAKPADSRASTSLDAVVMDASVSPKHRVDGFKPHSRRGIVDDAVKGQEKDDQARTKSPSLPRTSGEMTRQDTAQSSSPEHNRSPRVRIVDSNGSRNKHAGQDIVVAGQPANSSDSSYNTPASSPPPKTPSSDDGTHHGDHPSSVAQKGKEKAIADEDSSTASEASSTPHMDLATYPTQDLLRLLASLLSQIASANDGLREEAFSHRGEPHPGSRPNSPSSRNRTRQTSSGEMAGQFCIPPFRPRPSHAEGERRKSHESTSSTGHAAGKDSVVPAKSQDGSTHKEPADGRGAANVQNNDPASSSAATASASSSNGDAHLEVSPKTTASSGTVVPPSEASHTESASSAKTHRSKKSEHYRITTTAARQSLVHPSAILCFHARNVPSISIEAYLQRILKYCPITNEVFLSLLVYFDRMSKMQLGSGQANGPSVASEVRAQTGIQGFAIDSFNVHRLVIAGITVASKFFSDVFYTNSRYAKVGGLPQSELNQLELQFLLLNDFNLVIPLDEMQRYADQLLAYGQGKGMVGNTGPGIVYGHLPAMKPPSEQQRDSAASPILRPAT